jgi:hypothetical protein
LGEGYFSLIEEVGRAIWRPKIGPQDGSVESNHKLAAVLQYGPVVTLQSGSEPPSGSRVSSLAYIVGLRSSRLIRLVALAGCILTLLNPPA